MTSLFEPYALGTILLKNRIVMAPMTRSRVRNEALAPDADTALYYAQRAGAGLIVTEGLAISEAARGWAFVAGIHTPEQIVAWKPVTAAAHAKDGKIFAQLWHVGRASHVSLQRDRQPPLGVSDVQSGAVSFSFDEDGNLAFQQQSKPRILTLGEIPQIMDEFVRAARNAIAAGFDGVEIHAANGYLFEQFISGWLNTRTDRYGGASIENCSRFTLETVDAVTAAIGNRRVGIRVSPFGRYNDMHAFSDEAETWLAAAHELSARKLAYLHMSDQTTMGQETIPSSFMEEFRQAYDGTLILAGGFQMDNGQAAIDQGLANLIAIGRPFIANPIWWNVFETICLSRKPIARPSIRAADTDTWTTRLQKTQRLNILSRLL